ncbi:MAG: hypothetical protein WC992_08965 [Acholeplasmataceae bacterium]
MVSREEVLRRVIQERIRQDSKWGFPQRNTPMEWVSILTEEVGEFATAMNDALLGKHADSNLTKALEEVIQVAAVAISIVEHLDGGLGSATMSEDK